MTQVKLTDAMFGKYVDFNHGGNDHSGIIEDIMYSQFVVGMIDDFENEIEVLVPAGNITYVHEED